MNLYQINEAIQAKMLELAERLENGVNPSDDELDKILDLQGDLSNKLVNYGYVVKNLDGEVTALDDEIERLTARKKARKTHIGLLKNRMQQAMADNGLDKIDDPIMPIRLQNSAPSVRLDIDPLHLPEEFQRVEITADKTAIGKALKAGQEVKGAVLVQNSHIRIG